MCSERGFHPYSKGARIFSLAIAGIVTAVIFGFLFGYFVECLWNWLMPSLFKLGKITYWQAFGLILLARLVFGSIGHDHGNGRDHYIRHHYWHKNLKYCGIDDEWRIKENYYDSWWHEEGKAAFEKYIEKIEHKEGDSE